MTPEEYYLRRGYQELDKHDKRIPKFDYYELIDFVDGYMEVVRQNGLLHPVINCPSCDSDDLFTFVLEHIKCRSCHQKFEHGVDGDYRNIIKKNICC